MSKADMVFIKGDKALKTKKPAKPKPKKKVTNNG